MKFKIDENMPVDIVPVLNAAGYDVHTVYEENLKGAADSEIAKHCSHEGRVLLTLDLDFADIRNYPPTLSPGFIVFRLKSLDKVHILEVVKQLIPILKSEELNSRLWIVEEDQIRIRS